MVQQVLYVDYAGGKFEYWFYSDGSTYRYSAYEFSAVRRFYKKNDFTKLVETEEAKQRH